MEKNISRVMLAAVMAAGFVSCGGNSTDSSLPEEAFVRVQGQDLIKPDGTKLYIVGTNLGNWLNPEGYMFGFRKTNSPRFINEMFCEMVGEEFGNSSRTIISPAKMWNLLLPPEQIPSDCRFITSFSPMRIIWDSLLRRMVLREWTVLSPGAVTMIYI